MKPRPSTTATKPSTVRHKLVCPVKDCGYETRGKITTFEAHAKLVHGKTISPVTTFHEATRGKTDGHDGWHD